MCYNITDLDIIELKKVFIEFMIPPGHNIINHPGLKRITSSNEKCLIDKYN